MYIPSKIDFSDLMDILSLCDIISACNQPR